MKKNRFVVKRQEFFIKINVNLIVLVKIKMIYKTVMGIKIGLVKIDSEVIKNVGVLLSRIEFVVAMDNNFIIHVIWYVMGKILKIYNNADLELEDMDNNNLLHKYLILLYKI